MSILNIFKDAIGVGEYKATLKVAAQTYTSRGDSPIDAISKLSVSNVKGKGILVVENSKNRKERILTPFLLSRVFSQSKLTRQVALKNLAILFNF